MTVLNKCHAAQCKKQLLGDFFFFQHIFRLPSEELPAFFRPLQNSQHSLDFGISGIEGEQRVRFESSRWFLSHTLALVQCNIYTRPISDRKAVGHSLRLWPTDLASLRVTWRVSHRVRIKKDYCSADLKIGGSYTRSRAKREAPIQCNKQNKPSP